MKLNEFWLFSVNMIVGNRSYGFLTCMHKVAMSIYGICLNFVLIEVMISRNMPRICIHAIVDDLANSYLWVLSLRWFISCICLELAWVQHIFTP